MSKGKNHSTRLPKRIKPQVFIGDASPETPPKYFDGDVVNALLTIDEASITGLDDFVENMDDTETLGTALALGAKATDVLGVDKCYEHYGYKELGNKSIPGLKYSTDVVFCRNCFTQYYRKAR